MTKDDKKFTWFCYGLGMTDEEAAAAFLARFGYAAEQVIRDHNLIWCGPVFTSKESGEPEHVAESTEITDVLA